MRPKNTLLGSLIALGLSSGIWALPQDPTPVHGQVQIQNGANFVQILQQTPQAIINWNQFNIGLGETVRFLQPSQQAAILNRVTGLDPSVIQGMLQANGRVFLLNPNGILFGPNSVVDVGSFTASTLKMSNEDFLNGTYKLTQDNSLPLAALTNQGTIRVAEGGFVVLVSPLLDNQGMILAQSGHVNLGATTQATFSVDGRGLVQFVVPDGFDPQFQGGGKGGTVLLQPGQMSSLLSQVIANPALVEAGSFQAGNNGQVLAHGAEGVLLNSGTISTDSASGNGGTIRLDSSQATVLPASGVLSANSQTGDAGDVRLLSAGRTFSLGTISAAANGTGNGGFAEVSGKDLWLLGTVNVASAQGTGGTILLDPTDITIIDGAGGTFDGQLPNPNGAGAGSVSVTAMQGQSAVQLNATNDVLYNGAGFTLNSTSLSVNAGNDIRFTGASVLATTLALTAGRDITVASPNSLTVGSTAGAFTAQAGRHVTLTANSGNLVLRSPVQTTVTATAGHVSTSSTQGSGTFFNAPTTTLNAGGNVTVTGSDVLQNTGNNPVFLSGRNVTVQSQGAGLNFRTGSLNVTAGEDFAATATNGLTLQTLNGALQISAGHSLTATGSGLFVGSDSANVHLDAPTIALNAPSSGLTVTGSTGVNATASNGDFSATASGGAVTLTSGGGSTVNVTSSRDIRLLAGSGNLVVGGANNGSRFQAARDLSTSASQGSGTYLNGNRTDLIAGRNLTMTGSDMLQNTGNNPVFLNAQNVTVQSQGAGVNFRTGSLNVTAGEDFVATATAGLSLQTVNGPLQISAGRSLTATGSGLFVGSDTGNVHLDAPTIALEAPGGSISVTGSTGVNATASNGDFSATASGGAVSLTSGGGSTVNVTSSRDIRLLAGSGNLVVGGANNGSRFQAARDLSTSSSQGSGTYLNGNRTDLIAGRNLTMTGSDILQNTGNNPVFLNAQNVTVQSQGAGLTFRTGSLNVTAGEDFVATATAGLTLQTLNGPLQVNAGGDFAVSAATTFVRTDAGTIELTAGNLALANVGINAGGNGDVKLASAGNLTVGRIATGSSANATLTGANITIQSMQNISGGNYTITTPGNLTEITPATNPPTLTGLNITAGKAFNFNRADLGFSIPNAGFLAGLVTGGNETLPAPNDARAASFHTFTAGPDDFSPGHVEFQTGDIYRDGVKIYGGSPPPDPPPTPPAPPPVPNPPPPPPVEIPVTPQEAVQQQDALSPEQRSQILAQSNLALGNLGSFSRVLSDSEREVITTRHDSLHQTWSLDPFSPTLALTVPGGAPPVYPSELAQLTALLMMSSPSDDPEDKTRQAYNVIVDQELREIWEVRYWRHLLEDIIIWEDRE